jgi:hypothetical protein
VRFGRSEYLNEKFLTIAGRTVDWPAGASRSPFILLGRIFATRGNAEQFNITVILRGINELEKNVKRK